MSSIAQQSVAESDQLKKDSNVVNPTNIKHAPTSAAQPSVVTSPEGNTQQPVCDGKSPAADTNEGSKLPPPQIMPSPRKCNILPGYWDDVPSMDLFPAGSEEAKFFDSIPDSPTRIARMLQSPAPATSPDSGCRESSPNTVRVPVVTVEDTPINSVVKVCAPLVTLEDTPDANSTAPAGMFILFMFSVFVVILPFFIFVNS